MLTARYGRSADRGDVTKRQISTLYMIRLPARDSSQAISVTISQFLKR
jgi:hypothetical protein